MPTASTSQKLRIPPLRCSHQCIGQSLQLRLACSLESQRLSSPRSLESLECVFFLKATKLPMSKTANDFLRNCRKPGAQAFEDLCTVRADIHQHIAITSRFSQELIVKWPCFSGHYQTANTMHAPLPIGCNYWYYSMLSSIHQCVNCCVLRKLRVASDRFPLSWNLSSPNSFIPSQPQPSQLSKFGGTLELVESSCSLEKKLTETGSILQLLDVETNTVGLGGF